MLDTVALIASEEQVDAAFADLFPIENAFGPHRDRPDFEALRAEAARSAGVFIDEVSKTRTLRELGGKLFLLLLDGQNEEYVFPDKLIYACDVYTHAMEVCILPPMVYPKCFIPQRLL